MVNISSVIEKAKDTDVLWPMNEFYLVNEALTQAGMQVSFWEEEENWAVIYRDDYTVGYLLKRYPVFIGVARFFKDIRSILSGMDYLNYIVVNSIDEEILLLDRKISIEVFEEDLSTKKLSAEHLWFMTTSR